MSELFPFLLALFLTALLFAHAVKHGAVRLLASAISATAAFLVLFAGIRFLPGLAESTLRMDLSWGWGFGISLGAALCAYVIVLVIGGWLLNIAFAREGWFHWMGHGLLGGLLSLYPAAVAVFFLFWCARVSGTVIELNYVALVSRPDVERSAGGIRPMPSPARWRDTVESVPFVARLFDEIDPFSNRVRRNAAALAVMQKSPTLLLFLSEDPETEPLLRSEGVLEAIRDPAVVGRIHSGDRVGLVLSPEFRALVKDEEIASELSRVRLAPLLNRFASYLEVTSVGITHEIEP